MGDNRNHSLDSRKLGYFDFDNDVIGKSFLRFLYRSLFLYRYVIKKHLYDKQILIV